MIKIFLLGLLIFSFHLSAQTLVEDEWKNYPSQKEFIGQIVFQDTLILRKDWDPKLNRKEFRLGELIMARSFMETSLGNYYRLAHADGRYPMADWGVVGSDDPVKVTGVRNQFRVYADGELVAVCHNNWYAKEGDPSVDVWTSNVVAFFTNLDNDYAQFRDFQQILRNWVFMAKPGTHDILIQNVLADRDGSIMLGVLAEGSFKLTFNEAEKKAYLDADTYRTFVNSPEKNFEGISGQNDYKGKDAVTCSFYATSSMLTYYFIGDEFVPLSRDFLYTRSFKPGTGVYASEGGRRGELLMTILSANHLKAYVLPGGGMNRFIHLRDLPKLMNVKQYGISGGGGGNNVQSSAGGDAEKPEIKIIEPKDHTRTIATEDKFLNLEMIVTDNKQLFEVLVNGNEIAPKQEDTYVAEVPLGFGTNEIEILAKDVSGNVVTETIIVERNVGTGKKVIGRDGKDYALIFATNEYKSWSDLKNPMLDGQTVAKELEDSYGFETKLIENSTLDDFYAELKAYGKKTYNPGDQLFIFITGHGFYDDVFKEGYLVMNDSERPDSDPGRRSYIAHSSIKTILDNNSCEHIMLVLDACFSGAFESSGTKGEDLEQNTMSRSEFIRQKLKRKSRKFFTSGGTEYVSDGRPGAHSPFAFRFINALRSYGGDDNILTFNEIKSYLEKAKPMPRSGGFGSDAPGSDFIFIKKK